jgi:hypothetical protein
MNERKLIDEIKRLVNNDVIIGYYNGTTFTDDNGKTYASSYLVTNNSPIGRGFIVPYDGKWLVVVANNNQEVRKNIITSRRKISIEDKPKPTIDYLLTETLIKYAGAIIPVNNTFYTIRDNKWKKYELPEIAFKGYLNYYIDSNYVVIKGDEKDERFNQLTVLKDDVFTTYTYPEELPVLKTWRKDFFNTYDKYKDFYNYGNPRSGINKILTGRQGRLYRLSGVNRDFFYGSSRLDDIIEALSLEQSINLNIVSCRFTEDEIISCRKEPFKVKSPKLDTNIISPEEVNKQTIISTYIKFQ